MCLSLLAVDVLAAEVEPARLDEACELGDAESCIEAAKAWFEEHGDDEVARGYLVKACTLGSEEGCERLGYLRRGELLLLVAVVVLGSLGVLVMSLADRKKRSMSAGMMLGVPMVLVTSIAGYMLDLLTTYWFAGVGGGVLLLFGFLHRVLHEKNKSQTS